MTDPLAELVALLQPAAPYSKLVSARGAWSVRREEYGRPFFCVVLEGSCRLAADGEAPLILQEGDFVLIPAASGFTTSSLEPPGPEVRDIPRCCLPHGEIRHGLQEGPPDVRLLVGYCVFGSPDAALLVSLLPRLVHVLGESRLATLVQLVRDESTAQRPARDMVLARLLEVLLMEALRSTAGSAASPGLVRGLADERLAAALRRMHEQPAHPWTVAALAKEAALSRSAFFERFNREVGTAPMEYLLAWRMAMAKDLLGRQEGGVAEVAERVGYGSASAFSVAFARHVGVPPGQYGRGAFQLNAQLNGKLSAMPTAPR
jgi:AraC-like DNA-binding protein